MRENRCHDRLADPGPRDILWRIRRLWRQMERRFGTGCGRFGLVCAIWTAKPEQNALFESTGKPAPTARPESTARLESTKGPESGPLLTETASRMRILRL